jgi:protein-tyrosine phosphatase
MFWGRDLDDDLDSIAFWGARYVISLLTLDELRDFGLLSTDVTQDLGAGMVLRHLNWLHLPVKKREVPDPFSISSLMNIALELKPFIESGGRLLLHCSTGNGRSGMVCALFLVCMGFEPGEAIKKVRDVKGPRAIETTSQESLIFSVKQFLQRGGVFY